MSCRVDFVLQPNEEIFYPEVLKDVLICRVVEFKLTGSDTSAAQSHTEHRALLQHDRNLLVLGCELPQQDLGLTSGCD